ncbi:MAG: hypothetical protein WCK58_09535 [Chloroflexota bacterium]
MSLEEQVASGLRDRACGWWVRLVFDSFGYLETDFGYSLAEVRLHFRGNYIQYRGPVYEFVTEYDPDDTQSIHANLWLVADLDPEGQGEGIRFPRVLDVNRLLLARNPDLPLAAPMPSHLDRATVSDAIATWARGLRELAPDVLAGAWPEDVATP